MSKKRKSLARKISVTLILLAAPLFVVSLSSFFTHVQQLLHKEALERSNSILSTTMRHVVNYMGEVETAAKSNAWLLEENFTPDSLQALSRRIVKLNGSVLSCSVSTEPDVFPQYGHFFSVYSVNEGDTILTMRESEFDYYERVWYQTALQTGKPCWIDPFSDFNEGAINFADAVASYCVPLRPDGHKIAGVVSADFSFNRLAKTVIAAEHPFPNAYYMLLGADGRYLVCPETNLLFKKTIFSATDSVQHPDVFALGHAMTAGEKGIMHVDKDDKTYHVCYAPVPGTNWSLALVCLDDEILSDYYHLTHIAIIIVVVGLLLIMWMTSRVVKWNMKPLNQLLEVTQKIADGDYSQPIPHSDRKDVVAQLQNTFATMQQSIVSNKERIEQTVEEIRKENEELELATQSSKKSAEEKQQFIRYVLSKVRKPMNVVEGLTDVMLEGLSSRDRQKTFQTEEIGNIANQLTFHAAQLKRMSLMLIDISGAAAPDEVLYRRGDSVSCNKVAEECIGYTRTYYPNAEVRFETELPDDVCIQTNHLYLMRSLREFLYNSAKYTDGKHIVVRISQTETTVSFVFEDVGPGLPKEWQDLFFLPFIKGDKESAGLGLGLVLAKRHIVSLGGRLIYDADYQQGCRFTVEMPK